MVEIGKAIFNDSKILVMDEPTAVLTDKESKYFFDMVKKLKEKGVGIIYVSHRLEMKYWNCQIESRYCVMGNVLQN